MTGLRQHLFQHPDGRLVFIRLDNHDLRTSNVEVFLGAPGAPMPRVPVTEVEVVRDGGSLYVVTAAGIVFIPTALWSDGQPAFYADADAPAAPLTTLDPATVDIAEITAVVITPDAVGEGV